MDVSIYLLRVILYTGILWGIFRLLLRGSTRHAAGRLFLWLAVLLPFILPFMQLSSSSDDRLSTLVSLPEMVVSTSQGIDLYVSGHKHGLLIIYVLLALSLAARLLLRHLALRRKLRQASGMQVRDGIRIYTHTGLGPGSYGRAAFLPDGGMDEKIVQHELAHIKQYHYADLLLLQLVKTICWPNIFLYAIASDLKMIHEYQADQAAAGKDVNTYILRLLDDAFGTRQYSITHSFFHHPIKSRINMLQQKANLKYGAGRLILAAGLTLSMTFGTAWLQSCNFKKTAAPEAKTYTKVDQMPEFNGDLYQWLAANMKYPQDARLAGKEGRVNVSFVVDKEGQVKNVALDKSSGTGELDEAALQIVRDMPRWKPGRNEGVAVNVAYSLPVTYKLN